MEGLGARPKTRLPQLDLGTALEVCQCVLGFTTQLDTNCHCTITLFSSGVSSQVSPLNVADKHSNSRYRLEALLVPLASTPTYCFR